MNLSRFSVQEVAIARAALVLCVVSRAQSDKSAFGSDLDEEKS